MSEIVRHTGLCKSRVGRVASVISCHTNQALTLRTSIHLQLAHKSICNSTTTLLIDCINSKSRLWQRAPTQRNNHHRQQRKYCSDDSDNNINLTERINQSSKALKFNTSSFSFMSKFTCTYLKQCLNNAFVAPSNE